MTGEKAIIVQSGASFYKRSYGKKPSLELCLPSTLHPKAGFFVVVSWFPAAARALVSFFVSGEEPFPSSSCMRR